MINIHQYWVYILSNNSRTVLYIGVTNDLYRRYIEHREGLVEGFTKKYNCHSLVYCEEYSQIEEAIAREEQLKGWNRQRKEQLIKSVNPFLADWAKAWKWV